MNPRKHEQCDTRAHQIAQNQGWREILKISQRKNTYDVYGNKENDPADFSSQIMWKKIEDGAATSLKLSLESYTQW